MQKTQRAPQAKGLTGTSADYGVEVADASAERSIVITAATRHVNVVNGETIKFVFGNDSFSWHFQTWPNLNVFELARIAPARLGAASVKVYVAANPIYG